MNLKKFLLILLFIFLPVTVSAHQPKIIFSQVGDITINNPELSQALYDELRGEPRYYYIDSDKNFKLYINLLVPGHANVSGRYSANVFDANGKKIYSLDGESLEWKEFWEPYGRDWYFKGPELDQNVPAGKYKIEVFSKDNLDKYVLAVGKTEFYGISDLLNVYWQLPYLKLAFFKTDVLQFFLTPFGIWGIGAIGGLLILIALIYYIIGLIREIIKHNQAKTLLLTSGGMRPMKDEIIKLLQEPAYDIKVAFITTASKPEENQDYLREDLRIMREELGFNVEEVDIEGKSEHELERILGINDIVYVEGGSTFYLLKAMRECNFEKVIRKLLKSGKVYIGVSAGSMVAGRTIKTSLWKNPNKNTFGLKNLKGLNLVPFDIFLHYQPEHAEIIKQKMPNLKKRYKNLRIITDDQAILVQGKEIDLIGEGEAIVI